MISLRVLRNIRPMRTFCRLLSTTRSMSNSKENKTKSANEETALGDYSRKYQIFKDEDAQEILDVYEERLKYSQMLEEEEVKDSPFDGLNLERGITGVYEIEDLVEVLKRENAKDIFVARVPNEFKYVDYICVTTGKSQKHMRAIAQFVRRVYKQKRNKTDSIPKVEGENSKDWMALDLGNIALHIFSPEARNIYDLDSLWSVGAQFDEEFNKKDPISAVLEKHSMLLKDLEPAK